MIRVLSWIFALMLNFTFSFLYFYFFIFNVQYRLIFGCVSKGLVGYMSQIFCGLIYLVSNIYFLSVLPCKVLVLLHFVFLFSFLSSFLSFFFFLSCLLAPWRKALLNKLIGSQLVKKLQAFYGTRRFITAFTSTGHLSLSRAKLIQSMPHPT